jgi:hypothetical protein
LARHQLFGSISAICRISPATPQNRGGSGHCIGRAIPIGCASTQDAFVTLFGPVQGQWMPLAQSRLVDLDPWSVDPPQEIKAYLDAVFPVAGLDLNSVLASNALLDTASGRHARTFIGQIAPEPYCRTIGNLERELAIVFSDAYGRDYPHRPFWPLVGIHEGDPVIAQTSISRRSFCPSKFAIAPTAVLWSRHPKSLC